MGPTGRMLLRTALASLLLALVGATAAAADGPTVEIVSVEGRHVTVRADDGSVQEYEAARDLRIVTPSHHEIRLRDLRAGERVRMISGERGDETQKAYGIVVVQDARPAALPRGNAGLTDREHEAESESESEFESERETGGAEKELGREAH